jgi:hypothetical protein
VSVPPHDLVDALRRFVAHRLTRVSVCWLLCLGLAAARWHHAYHSFDTPRLTEDVLVADRADPTAREAARTQSSNEGLPLWEYRRARADGNNGHTWIDFGGQYVFGRTAADGHWRELYHRDTLRRTAEAAYPMHLNPRSVQMYHDYRGDRPSDLKFEDYTPDSGRLLQSMVNDAVENERNSRLGSVVGAAFSGGAGNPFAAAAGAAVAEERIEADKASEKQLLGKPLLGGPLYPPVHAILYAPLGMIRDTQRAYFLFQLLSVVAVFASGLAVRAISRGRVWWSVATITLFLLPGMRAGLDLGQNHAITLGIVLVGWAVAARASEFGGGMVWGLLAFKPVWGLAFILAPILLGRWRFVAGTAVVGCGLCAATLPFVGVEGWKNWFEVGQSANKTYNTDENWINLSRDLSGIPKRLLIDFSKPRPEGGELWINAIGMSLQAGVGLLTVVIGVGAGRWKWLLRGGPFPRVWRVQQWFKGTAAAEYLLRGYGTDYIGLRAAFVLFGGYLTCYKFMYYDSVLTGLGLAALLAYPRWQLAGWRAELRQLAQSPAARRTFLFVSSAPLTLLLLLLLTDNAFLYCGQQVTLANDQFLKDIPDPSGATHTHKADDGTPTTSVKTVQTTRQLKMRFDYNHPVETFLVVILWGWCGWRLLRTGDHERHPPPAT